MRILVLFSALFLGIFILQKASRYVFLMLLVRKEPLKFVRIRAKNFFNKNHYSLIDNNSVYTVGGVLPGLRRRSSKIWVSRFFALRAFWNVWPTNLRLVGIDVIPCQCSIDSSVMVFISSGSLAESMSKKNSRNSFVRNSCNQSPINNTNSCLKATCTSCFTEAFQSMLSINRPEETTDENSVNYGSQFKQWSTEELLNVNVIVNFECLFQEI